MYTVSTRSLAIWTYKRSKFGAVHQVNMWTKQGRDCRTWFSHGLHQKAGSYLHLPFNPQNQWPKQALPWVRLQQRSITQPFQPQASCKTWYFTPWGDLGASPSCFSRETRSKLPNPHTQRGHRLGGILQAWEVGIRWHLSGSTWWLCY